MPIYTYRPKVEHAHGAAPAKNPVEVGSGQNILGTSCCHFDYLHLPGAPDSEPWQQCPTCGRAIERVPSAFAATGLGVSATAQALRRAGCGDYADAWEQSEREAATAPKRALPQSSGSCASAGRSDESQAMKALRTASSHVCTASCRHGLAE